LAESFDRLAVVAAVRRYADVGDGEVSVEPCPAGRFNMSYFVRGYDGEVVIRIAPGDDAGYVFYERGMMAREPRAHALVREKTHAPVARVLGYDTRRDLLGRDFMVLERLPGHPLSSVSGVAAGPVWRQVGGFLREVHGVTGPGYGYEGPPGVMELRKTWGEAFHYMWNRLVDDVEECGGYDRDEADVMRSLLDRGMSFIDRDVPASLLHMDLWSQNVLVGADGRVTGLLDWDRRMWGDPEIEFAVLDYCGVSGPPFWEGYGSTRPDGSAARFRRVVYLLYESQKYIVIYRTRRKNEIIADGYRRNALGLAMALFEDSGV